jgi:hypothetical protein
MGRFLSEQPGAMSDYFVTVLWRGKRAKWAWEILRPSRPMDVRVQGVGYRSAAAARQAGENALREYLADG